MRKPPAIGDHGGRRADLGGGAPGRGRPDIPPGRRVRPRAALIEIGEQIVELAEAALRLDLGAEA